MEMQILPHLYNGSEAIILLLSGVLPAQLNPFHKPLEWSRMRPWAADQQDYPWAEPQNLTDLHEVTRESLVQPGIPIPGQYFNHKAILALKPFPPRLSSQKHKGDS